MRSKEERTRLRPGGSQNPPGRLKSWLKLFIGIAALWFLTYVVGPFVDNLPWIKPATSFIDDSGINTPAFYYTAVEEVGDAEAFIRNSLKYPPQKQ